MESLWLTLRAELRRRWRPMLGLAVLLGVIGGVVLTAAAGAERTDTAYPRAAMGQGRPGTAHPQQRQPSSPGTSRR